MRPLVFLIISSALTLMFACKPSVRSAAEYNNQLVRHQTKVGETQKELFTIFKDGKPDEMKQVLNRFKSRIREIADSVANLPAFDGKDDFKKATLVYLEQLNSVAENECSEIVNLYSLPDTTYSDIHEKKVIVLRELINEKTEKALNELGEKQQKFAQEYHFKIE